MTRAVFQLFFVIFLTVFGISTNAQTYTGKASARIFESVNKEHGRIMVVYENGEHEIIPLRQISMAINPATNNDNLIENQKIIHAFLQGMEAKGYETIEIKSNGGANMLNLFILFKKKN